MAATVSAWATKPGAWALDAEEHEEELQQERKAMEEQQQQSKYSAASAVASSDFPSLSAGVATKGKKKKAQTLSLAEFSSYSAVKVNRLTNEDLMKLPTGPRERSAEEMMEGGRGFRSYGMGRSEGGDRWGGGGGRGGEGEGRREPREPLGPSRADEIDNWAIGKKAIGGGGGGGGFERRERTGGSFFGSDSKADESDSWVSKKSFAPSSDGPPRRFGVSSGGFERERRSYEPFTANSGGADADTWGRKREERVVNVNGGENGSFGRPKLNLQRRTLPVTVERPQSPNVDVAVVKPESPGVVVKPRSFNPFGEARPREEVLAEKGQDWKKIDEQLESLKIKEIGAAGAEGSDRPGSAKKGFGGRRGLGEEKTERSWRKPESVDDAYPTSADKPAEKIEENGNSEEK